ncbi:S-layer homology domain-containing protein [Paenibacillus sp. IITD108]|uniref:S-layer homology domain-containing protein n=1 Tax=Paenibacillus sp. IITD108 TaxID=3116649 RepID=UPI002F3F8BBB
MKGSLWRKSIAMLLCIVLLIPSIPWIGGNAEKSFASGPANLISNGSFEMLDGSSNPSHWETYTFTGTPQYGVTNSESKEGEHSYQIRASEQARGQVRQVVHLTSGQAGKDYVFQQWVKTEDIISTGRVYARVQMYDSGGTRTVLVESSVLRGTNDWTLIQKQIYIPEGTVRIMWEGFLENSTGTAWFDDIQLYEYAAPAELLVNGGYETMNNGASPPWTTYTFSGSPVYSVDQTIARTGSNAYKIEADSMSRGALIQSIVLSASQKGKQYRMQQWVKTEDYTGKVYYRIQVYDQSNTRIAYIESTSLAAAEDWTLIEKVVDIPADAHKVTWESFYENGTGKVWFDDSSMLQWIPIDGIKLLEEQVILLPGETKSLSLQISPEDAVETLISWESSNPAVATVSDGAVTGLSDGIALITAKTEGTNKGKSAVAVVYVGEPSGITVSNVQETVLQGGFVSGAIEAESADEGLLAYELFTEPAHGLAYLTVDGKWEYYPDPSFTGEDSFYVTVKNEAGDLAAARVAITVTPVHKPPQLEEGIYPTNKNTAVSGTLKALSNHPEGLQYEVEQQPANGQLVMDGLGSWTYTPNQDYVGNDTFYVRVTSSLGGSSSTYIHVYTAPTAEEIIAELKAEQPNNSHPRLMATADDFARIRQQLADNNPQMKEWFKFVKSQADAMLSEQPRVYNKPDGLRLDTTSATRIATLAFVYQITEDDSYAQRAWQELEHVSSAAYPDWSPGHFLDTAMMTHGVSLGYDWLYHVLTEQQRATIREAIADKGLTPAVPMYLNKTYWWVYNRDNWNFVSNAGMTLGALAIADEEEELAGLILREAFKSIQFGLPQYAPDGSATEGPAYWEYGTMYLIYFLSSLNSVFGHDFGFSEREGIAETAEYPIYIAGPKGAFNYFDNGSSLIPGRLLLWFAEHFNKPEYTWYHQFASGASINPGLYDMLWYREGSYGAAPPADLDQHFILPKAVTMRSSWNDPNALFVGFKGGENGAPHGDLDTGSFVFDANGVRWALDLGSENYNLPGYWDMSETGLRWTYYRKRAEGHNTLVIQPSAGVDQSASSISEITRTSFESSEGAFAIADLTPAYQKSAVSVKRGTALIDHRRQFLVQDEVKLKVPSELYWFMHTRADIELKQNGTIALLSQDGRQLAVEILSPVNASFSVMPAEPLPTSLNPAGQTRNVGVQKLAIHLEEVKEAAITVRMTPIINGDLSMLDDVPVVPLDEWEIEAGEIAVLSGLAIDGVPLADFQSDRYVYDVELPRDRQTVPVVTGTSSQFEVSVQPAAQLPGTTIIKVKDPNAQKKPAVYYIVFKQTVDQTMPPEDRKIIPAGVTASTHDGNVPENTLDNNFNTRWSAEGDQWIQYDLGGLKKVAALAVAWYQGNIRSSYFQIELSEDGIAWSKVFDGFSSGSSIELELHSFSPVTARYVRIKGFGNTSNAWNSIAEVAIFGPAADAGPPDTETPGGGNENGGNGGDTDDGDGDNSSGSKENENESESAVENGATFNDIKNHWAESLIKRAAALNLINGFPDGTFRPNDDVTREQFTVMLMNALKSDSTKGGISFADHASISSWARESVEKAIHAGIISGYEDGTFRPAAYITRAQLAVMIARALDLPAKKDNTGSYTDYHDIPKWARESVNAVHEAGIMQGRGKKQFIPNGHATRAEVITVLLRMLEVQK